MSTQERKVIKDLKSKEILGLIKLGPVGTKILTTMETHLQELIDSQTTRPILQIKTIVQKKMDLPILIQLSHTMICTGSQEGQGLTNLTRAIGSKIQRYYKLKVNEDDSQHIGAFIINAYAVAGLVSIKKKKINLYKDQTMWCVFANNRNQLRQLIKEFAEVPHSQKPLKKQPEDWVAGIGEDDLGSDLKIIKEASTEVLKNVNPITCPLLFNAINKKQKIAYRICKDTLRVYQYSMKNNTNAFEHNANELIGRQRKEAKIAEAEFIQAFAECETGNFYQRYNADYRGRIYPQAGFLNEISSDRAKGLIQFANGQPFGATGKDEFFHHIANMYGEDKLPHEGRVKFVNDNYEEFCSYGYDPIKNTGWHAAENVWQFLQSCIELAKFDVWIKNGYNEEDFVSHVICYRDGSNNGMQWLFSLAKDDRNAHLVNVKPTSDGLPGDFYKHIANSVISFINSMKCSEEEKTAYFETWQALNKKRSALNKVEAELFKLENGNTKTPIIRAIIKKLESEKEIIKNDIFAFTKANKAALAKTDRMYWQKAEENGITAKEWRSIVKRPSMTYGYSAKKQGMGSQIIDDTKDTTIPYLANKSWSAARLLGALIYESIEKEFPNVRNIMEFFRNNCDAYIKKYGKQYRHKTPISNFPLIQNYWKEDAMSHKNYRLYTTNRDGSSQWSYGLRLSVKIKTKEIDTNTSKRGISPNTIHSFDALHLMLVIDKVNFPIVSAHDSYGCHAGNVVVMQNVIREMFLKVIESDPIKHIIEDTGNLVEYPEVGNLDPQEILKSEYAFS